MNEVIGQILPSALGVAISPVPIIAVILMLMAPQAKASSIAFMLGWLLGITAVVTILALVVDPANGDDSSPTWVAWIKIALGVVLLLIALKQWRSRPAPGVEPPMPGWMSAIDKFTPAKALGFGAVLSAANPKNLALCAAAGVAIGSGDLTAGQTTVAIVAFVVIGGASIAVPVIGYLLAQQRMRRPLEELRAWLAHNNASVMAVLMLVLGTVILGQGIGGL